MIQPPAIYTVTDPGFRLAGEQEVLTLVSLSWETQIDRFLLPGSALPPEFFDLSSGLVGVLTQKLSNYRLRVAAVQPDQPAWSSPFRDFAAESRRGRTFGLFADRASAEAWLLG